MRARGFLRFPALAALMLCLCGLFGSQVHAQSGATGAADTSTPGGPLRLRQPQGSQQQGTQQQPAGNARTASDGSERDRPAAAYVPGEFELYVQRLTNDPTLRRFGTELVLDAGASRNYGSADTEVQAPPDYRVAPGDELLVALWGSVDADLRLTVDRSGRVSIPRVGVIAVAGLTLPDVTSAIDRQARKSFKNYQISVSVGQLRSMRVFVTGFAVRPGAYTVGALSTLSSVLFSRAGGPSAAGSFRDIELRRNGRVVSKLDLYDLMLFGRRDADQTLQANDVVHVGPVSKQVALIGSVNKPAIFELKAGESIKDVLNMGGGLNSVADRSRIAIERLTDRNDKRVRQVDLTSLDTQVALDSGDVVRAFSAVDAVLPLERQNKRVRLEGEVQRPGTYILPPESTIADALKAAGGLTSAAYVFGTEFTRESVRQTQQVNYERALRDIELELNRKATATGARSQEDIAAQTQQQVASDRLLARLRESKPTGRIVLQLNPSARDLPELALEDGDRLYVPPLPTSVGVFGSVFNAGSYLYSDKRKVDDYLRLAGSATRGADKDSIFVVRANGSVTSAQQGKNWFAAGSSALEQSVVLPGDTIFVPEEANKTTFLQNAKDWTQILYQMGLGIAAFRTFVP